VLDMLDELSMRCSAPQLKLNSGFFPLHLLLFCLNINLAAFSEKLCFSTCLPLNLC
jgi:hypothetical protein